MLIFRFLAIAIAVLIMLCAAGYVLTSDKRYLRWAMNLVKIGVAGGLVFFGVLLLERI
jgi:hypothetical protein